MPYQWAKAFIRTWVSPTPVGMGVFLIFLQEGRSAMKREGEIRIPSGCAVSAVISRDGNAMTGENIIKSMLPMHDRSNGLGGGFAGYGF